ncbi:MAG: fibronectin type III domain-containing protein [Deltaproteobacteria bacterium]|nr:fibronectin type III domain-containing protein [Deltaproteobacteria bacterium]
MTKRSSPPVLPGSPTDLVAIAFGNCQVILAWTECGAGGLGSRIERADGNGPYGPFVEIGGVGPHVTAFNDVSVKPRTTYAYRVHAWNASGDSSPSNVEEVTTPQDEMEIPAD